MGAARDEHAGLLEALDAIPVEQVTYQEWVSVGMALKSSGFALEDWERWSSRDTRKTANGSPYYSERECQNKWRSFSDSDDGVGSGSIIRIAEFYGWEQPTANSSEAVSLDDAFVVDNWSPEGGRTEGGRTESGRIDQAWVEDDTSLTSGGEWASQIDELSAYLQALFDSDDHVNFVTSSFEDRGRLVPKGGTSRTCAELIERLSKASSLEDAVGSTNKDAGAWIRFNPMDGQGRGNANVTEYRYALIESDSVPVEKQRGMIEAMNLPCAAIVYSGGKSVHAIVRIDAGTDYDLYRKRVNELYDYCERKGFRPDTSNKNPSRLSRMPGVRRGEQMQRLLSVNTGPTSWERWREWVADSEDNLPDTTSLADVWDDLPPVADPIIGTEDHGVLRRGHKMLLAGPSKAGKSFLLMELACALASGREWIGFPCAKGRVLYVNLEIDRASCERRLHDIFCRMGAGIEDARNIDVWNLRGRSVPMDALAPRLIHRARTKGYVAVIIDPIYKVITGDENSASDMAKFCNQFDRVAEECSCSVIYCHHFAKGLAGDRKSLDRASGSGVFARDPDALLTISPLDLSGMAVPMDGDSPLARGATGWRLEGTLREFASFEPVSLWFEWPLHTTDSSLDACKVETSETHKRRKGKRPSGSNERGSGAATQARREIQRTLMVEAVERAGEGCSVTELSEAIEWERWPRKSGSNIHGSEYEEGAALRPQDLRRRYVGQKWSGLVERDGGIYLATSEGGETE